MLGEKAKTERWGGREREASAQGERDGEEGGMRRWGEPREAAPPARSHPADGGFTPPCTAPQEEVPPGRAGNFLALGGGSDEAVAGSKFGAGGKHKGVCPRPWVASPGSGGGKGTLSELQEPDGERCC